MRKPILLVVSIVLTGGAVALAMGFRQVQRQVVVLSIQSYTNRTDGLAAQIILSNGGPVEVKLDTYFMPTFRVRAETPKGWTNYDIAEVIGGDWISPGSNTTFTIALPQGTQRWELRAYLLCSCSRVRANALTLIPWTHNLTLNNWLLRLHFNRWGVRSRAFEVGEKASSLIGER